MVAEPTQRRTACGPVYDQTGAVILDPDAPVREARPRRR